MGLHSATTESQDLCQLPRPDTLGKFSIYPVIPEADFMTCHFCFAQEQSQKASCKPQRGLPCPSCEGKVCIACCSGREGDSHIGTVQPHTPQSWGRPPASGSLSHSQPCPGPAFPTVSTPGEGLDGASPARLALHHVFSLFTLSQLD